MVWFSRFFFPSTRLQCCVWFDFQDHITSIWMLFVLPSLRYPTLLIFGLVFRVLLLLYLAAMLGLVWFNLEDAVCFAFTSLFYLANIWFGFQDPFFSSTWDEFDESRNQMMKKNSDFWVRPVKRLQGNSCNYNDATCIHIRKIQKSVAVI
jgi:hypothetical protein